MKPRILIVSEEDYAKNVPHFIINCDYGTAVGQAGGLPLVMLDNRHPEDYAELGDGLLLTGGNDIHCAHYGEIYRDASEIPALSRGREALEFQLCRMFLDAGKPILGIGRGMQVLNVVLGGTLHREIAQVTCRDHLSVDEKGFSRFVSHPISVTIECKLSEVLQDGCLVNSCHHQAVKTLGEGLVACAWAEDQIIEAVEHVQLPVFGVQWHPERADQGGEKQQILEYFITLCKEGAR